VLFRSGWFETNIPQNRFFFLVIYSTTNQNIVQQVVLNNFRHLISWTKQVPAMERKMQGVVSEHTLNLH